MTDSDRQLADSIAAILETMLVRRFRESLYDRIGEGAPVPIRDGTYPVLNGLRVGPATAAELARQIGVDRTVVSRQASQLAAADLVDRHVDPGDRRGGLLSLTDRGRLVADDLHRSVSQVVWKAIGPWPASDREAFAGMLTDFAGALGGVTAWRVGD